MQKLVAELGFELTYLISETVLFIAKLGPSYQASRLSSLYGHSSSAPEKQHPLDSPLPGRSLTLTSIYDLLY